MKRSKFTDAQIAFVLKQAEEGTSVAEVCRKAGIAEATFYNWRKKYAGILLGARTCEQLTSNLHAVTLEVAAEEMFEELTRISAPGLLDYPYGFVSDWSGVRHWQRLGT